MREGPWLPVESDESNGSLRDEDRMPEGTHDMSDWVRIIEARFNVRVDYLKFRSFLPPKSSFRLSASSSSEVVTINQANLPHYLIK